MSDFSKLHHKDINKMFYVNEDEEGNEYLAYQLKNDPLEQEHFVLYLDDYGLLVDENDFGQDVLVYIEGTKKDGYKAKYIDFDNIELEDGLLTLRANGDDGEYEKIEFDLYDEEEDIDNEEEEDIDNEEEEDIDDDEEEDIDNEEEEDIDDDEEEDIEEEKIDPEEWSRKVYLNYHEPEVFNPNRPVKNFSFRPGAINEMRSEPKIKIKSSTKQTENGTVKVKTRVVDLISSTKPSLNLTFKRDRLYNKPIIPSAMIPNEQEYIYDELPRSKLHLRYKNGTGNRYVKCLNRFPYEIETSFEPEWYALTRQYDYWKYKQPIVSNDN